MTGGKLALKFPRSRGKIRDSQIFTRQRGNLIANFPKSMIAEENFENLTDGNLQFSGKQRISLSINFPMHVNEGKLADKEIPCLPLNFPLAYHMREI